MDDKLKRLMREELQTSLQPMVLSTPTTHVTFANHGVVGDKTT